MEAATTLPAGPTTGLFAELGGTIFQRAMRILGDEAAAARVAEELFVRFLVHGNAQGLDGPGRWRWVYRVATSHCLRQLPDEAQPGAAAVAYTPAPTSQSLRRLDEPTQNMVVLSTLDGLSPEEIADVLDLPLERIQRRLASAAAQALVSKRVEGTAASSHPSMLALNRDSGLHTAHLEQCERCRALVADSDRLAVRFARDLAPAAIPRVGAAVRAERARRSSGPRWNRVLWLGGGAALVAGLALVVARPRSPDRADVPYAGRKGASRAKAAGIQISVGHEAEVRRLDPTTAVRPGDRLYFRMRIDRPRYLELRVRDGAGEKRLFPVGAGEAVLVQPGQALPMEYLITPVPPAPGGGAATATATATAGATGRKIAIVGLFADHPFPVDGTPGSDVEVVPVRVEVEP